MPSRERRLKLIKEWEIMDCVKEEEMKS